MCMEKYGWLQRCTNGCGEVWVVMEMCDWLWRSMNGCGEVLMVVEKY